ETRDTGFNGRNGAPSRLTKLRTRMSVNRLTFNLPTTTWLNPPHGYFVTDEPTHQTQLLRPAKQTRDRAAQVLATRAALLRQDTRGRPESNSRRTGGVT